MEQLVQMLLEEKGAFAYGLQDLPGYTGDVASFTLIDPTKRMWSPPRRYTEEEVKFAREKVQEMLDAGIVKEIPTTCPHASAITLPMKRAPDGSWTDKRFCIDLRQVNGNTVVDSYGLPLPEELFRRIRGHRFLVKADFRAGFWQINLSEEAQQHVAFHAPDSGKRLTYTRLCFGHVNATAIFQRAMEKELAAAGLSHCAAPFVDDVILWSDSWDEMIANFRKLLRHLQTVGLRLHPAKTIIGADCLPYLGHLVSAKECRPEPDKIAGIKALQPPTHSLKRLQAHLGLFNYYRCYVPNFAIIAKPLYKLMEKGAQYVWSDDCHQAYEGLRDALCQKGIGLRQPVDGRSFHLYVDWSNTGIAAVLNQEAEDGTQYMVACASRSLNAAEQNYPAWKGEMMAAVWGVKLYRPYLHSREFHLHTDHRALLWLLTQKTPIGQQMRWILALQEYRFSLVHRQGKSNPADVPSREASSCVADTTGARLDTELQDWVPKVLLPDCRTADPTTYTHDSLALDLGITGKRAAAPEVAAVAVGGSAGDSLPCSSPAAVLPSEAATGYNQQQLEHAALCCLLCSNESAVDTFSPTPDTLLGGDTGELFRNDGCSTDTQHPAVAWRQQDLQQAASAWVTLAALQHPQPDDDQPGAYAGTADPWGIRVTERLNTTTVASTFFPAALQQGVVLYEPFGGICAGLEAVLRSGIAVRQYLYSDVEPTAQRAALHRIRVLQTMYPKQLSEDALAGSFSILPMDVRQVTTQKISEAISEAPVKQWLVVGGWPCQDFSAAGKSQGMRGERAQLLSDLMRILGALQQLLPHQPPAYLLENVPMQQHRLSSISQHDFETIKACLGQPVVLDAAQAGSLAHRARNFWCNLVGPNQLKAALTFVKRPPARSVQLAMGPGRTAQPVNRQDAASLYP
jgi:hypothetical protein